jgi:TRAP-type C4-dicarboxylate transport system permease large subunit
VPTGTIWRGVTPFLIADVFRVAVLVAFPSISLWLPRTLGL